ncbi:MAG: putative 3-methyladenine DNA glycosylase [Bacteroidia bacterium]|nr:putative 3-methyladenine DNA glycosylase [Bacteroidia bacterium]
MSKLPKDFYLQDDVVSLSKQLLGKVLFTREGKTITAGIITETEAYAGITDKASHAYGGRRTQRTETMYAEGGVSYVYLCYGMYSLFNVVTNEKDIPHAVLVRAIQPFEGINKILERRKSDKLKKGLTTGPGKVSIALGINFRSHNAQKLSGNKIWIEDRKISFPENKIFSGPRIGVDYAGEDAKLPYRFWINEKENR